MAKLSLQLIQSDVRILDHIMQKTTGHRHRIQLETSQNTRHLNRVNDVGLSRFAELLLMSIHRIVQGLAHKGHILFWHIGSRQSQDFLSRHILFFHGLSNPSISIVVPF